jgi:hypothetical protein
MLQNINLKMSFYDDSRSVTTNNSTAQETIDSLHEETQRRNTKKMEILRNKKKVDDQPPLTILTGVLVGSSDDLSTKDEPTTIVYKKNPQISRCIMTVRTQRESMESIHEGLGESSSRRRSQIRKKRRQINRKLRKDLLRMSATGGSSSSGVAPDPHYGTSEQSVVSCSVNEHQSTSSILIFHTVTIREYSIIPGDNPSVSKGVPLTIDWDHQWERTCDLDAYEKNKQAPRRQIEMKMPPEIRSELLRKNGHSWKDIQASIKMANIARRQRTKTIESHASKANLGLGKIAKRMRSALFPKKCKHIPRY